MRATGWVALMLAIVLIVTEVSMRPSGDDRMKFVALFGTIAIVTLLSGHVGSLMSKRLGAVRHAVAAPGLLGIAVAAAASLASAGLMFVSSHDLTVFLIALAFAVGLAVVVSMQLGNDLENDLLRVDNTLKRVAAGERDLRTGVSRPDELGLAALRLDRLIEALASAENAEVEANRARDRMLAALSHDLRTPLTAMRAAVEALQDDVADDPRRYLRSIEADLRALTGLVDDLFLLSRMESGDVAFEAQTVDLRELADEAVEALTPVAEHAGVAIDIQSIGDVMVTGGSRELGRAIRNLIDNALHHSPNDSTVRVLLSNGGPTATLRVIDEGPGFAPEFRGSAFEEFTRDDPARTRGHGGAGLGLAIVRGIVEAHNGSVWIDEGPHGVVGFELPVGSVHSIDHS